MEAGARHLKSRAVTAVVVLTAALAATAGFSGPAAAAELAVSQLPAVSTATSVAGEATNSVPVAPVVEGTGTTVRSTVEQTVAATPVAPVAQPAVRAVARTAEVPARVVAPTPVSDHQSRTPSATTPAPAPAHNVNGGPNGQPNRPRTPSRRAPEAPRAIHPSVAQAPHSAPKPAAPAAGELTPAHQAGNSSPRPDHAPLPAPPTGAAAAVASASAFAPLLAGMALLALALGLSDPGVSRRLRLPSAAWRPQNLVFRLERPG